MEFRPRPYSRPLALVRMPPDDRLVLRVETRGERMATHLRPMTLRDAFRFRLR
jgi:hypothetical protein